MREAQNDNCVFHYLVYQPGKFCWMRRFLHLEKPIGVICKDIITVTRVMFLTDEEHMEAAIWKSCGAGHLKKCNTWTISNRG